MLYNIILFILGKILVMDNISLSNSCVNCINHEQNKCKVHQVEVTPANTCEIFTNG